MAYYLPVFIFVVCSLYYLFTRTFKHWKKKNVKGPIPIPLFGNFIDVALRRKHVGMIYKEIYDQFPEEKVVGIYRMTSPSLIIRDLDIIKQILIKDFEAFPERGIEFSKKKLGDNLFHCGVDTWSVLRIRLTTAFTPFKMRNKFYQFDESGDRLIEYMKKSCSKQQCQNVYTFFQKYTMAVSMIALFGLEIDAFNDESQLFDNIGKRMFRSTYLSEMDFLYPGLLKKYNLALFPEIVIKFCNKVTQTVIKQRSSSPSEWCDIMDILVSLKNNSTVKSSKQLVNKEPIIEITDEVIAGQVFIFFVAGYGNNSLSLSYAMYHLAQNIDIQDKLIAEIDEKLQKHDRKLTYDCLKDMKYLDMIFAETLRMHPLTNSITRTVNQDYKIVDVDTTIDKGTSVIISPYAIHHDEIHYPNPEKFDPLRFSPEVAKNRHPCAYLPFGAGPRGCLGSQFAKIQFGVCVVKLLSNYRVEISGKTTIGENYDPWRTLLTPNNQFYLNLISRN